ncbi:phage holin family protein [Chloroflexia bacterium SDU3-3]|nr:phage holin family protein [Chloroflexia bacterium SDU3-3]
MTEREPSVGTLVSSIVGDVQALARQEITLAREEIREELTTAKQAGIKLGIAAAVLGVGTLFLLIALAFGLNALFSWPTWAGFTLVGVVAAVVGGIMLAAGQKQAKEVHPVPEKTIETLKENAEWIKDRTTSDRI